MDSNKTSAALYGITAVLFVICAAVGDSPAFYGVAAAFAALAAAQAANCKKG